MPKPVAHVVGYSVAGLTFYHIPHVSLARKKESKNAFVTVVGGTLSTEQLVLQLQRIVPVKWRWDPVVNDFFFEESGRASQWLLLQIY